MKNNVFFERLFIAGSGGQGVLQLGRIIAKSVIQQDFNVTFYPSYGAEVRGGTANCTVIISDGQIISPVIDFPDSFIVLNNQSYTKFEKFVERSSIVIANSSLIDKKVEGSQCKNIFYIEATEIAETVGSSLFTNIVMLGVYIKLRKFLKIENVIEVIKETFKDRPEMIEKNIISLERGFSYVCY